MDHQNFSFTAHVQCDVICSIVADKVTLFIDLKYILMQLVHVVKIS